MKRNLTVFLILLITILSVAGCGVEKDNKVEGENESKDVFQIESENNVNDESDNADEVESSSDASTIDPSLSQDWKSGQFQLNGKVLTIPCKLSDFEDVGFYLSDSEPYSINPESSVRGLSLRSEEGYMIPAMFSNLGNEVIDIKDSSVTEFTVLSLGNRKLDIVFAGNLKLGSSLEDVKAVYGEPDVVNDFGGDEKYIQYDYKVSDKQFLRIDFNSGELDGYYISLKE